MTRREAKELEAAVKMVGDLGYAVGALATYHPLIETLTKEKQAAYAEGFKAGFVAGKAAHD